MHVPNPGPSLWFNPGAFALPGYAYGAAPRNPVYRPGLHTLDASLSKSFKMPFGEAHRILFRLEASMRSTRQQFGSPGTSLGTSTFGIITSSASTDGNRVVQAALKYNF